MKKTYKAPKYKTIDLTGEAMMIAESLTGGDPTTINEDVLDPNNALVKGQRGSLWDDEW